MRQMSTKAQKQKAASKAFIRELEELRTKWVTLAIEARKTLDMPTQRRIDQVLQTADLHMNTYAFLAHQAGVT